MYACTHTHTRSLARTRAHARMHAHTHTHTHAHTHTHTHTGPPDGHKQLPEGHHDDTTQLLLHICGHHGVQGCDQ